GRKVYVPPMSAAAKAEHSRFATDTNFFPSILACNQLSCLGGILPRIIKSTPGIAAMQLALEGGTETGSMLLFDPKSLPPEIDARVRRSRRLLKKLAETGALYRIPQNAEG